MSRILTLAALIAATTTAAPALAHVSFEQAAAPAGSAWKAVLRVPHGCDGAATTALRIELPAALRMAKPMPHPGWTLATEPAPGGGLAAIGWSGGALPDAQYDEFTFRATLPADLAPGTVIAVPVIQSCGAASIAWTATGTGAGEPAPALTVTAAGPTGHGHHGAMAMPGGAAPDAVTLGDLTLSGAFARATPPGAPVAGAFVTIENRGAEDDRLVAASAPFAARTEIHEMSMQGDRMQMRALPGGVGIPAHGTVTLAPGGRHVMFMDLTAPLVEGTRAEMVLRFEKAGAVTVPLAVTAPGATAPHGH
ncbi:copper chaperone PCu(A)C [Frigidibacter sp. MR17.24]|uniref:copper chaperone PCu(A)C n=1 Tax=Frigidibacter sp. MR17.24 TaxID=3127345 RepID=UPI0030130439